MGYTDVERRQKFQELQAKFDKLTYKQTEERFRIAKEMEGELRGVFMNPALDEILYFAKRAWECGLIPTFQKDGIQIYIGPGNYEGFNKKNGEFDFLIGADGLFLTREYGFGKLGGKPILHWISGNTSVEFDGHIAFPAFLHYMDGARKLNEGLNDFLDAYMDHVGREISELEDEVMRDNEKEEEER